MRRFLPLVPVLAFGLGAKAQEAGTFLLVGGVACAFLVLLGLPLGLLLHGGRRDFLDAEARAVERRATACALIGAGLVFASAFVVMVFAPRAPFLSAVAAACAAAWFYVGFAGCARVHGARTLGASADPSSTRTLVLGWLARAGLFAVPVAWPFLGCYLVVVAFGAPMVALFQKSEDATPST